MLYRWIVRCAWGTALAAALAYTATAQTDDFTRRLLDGQKLRSEDRYTEARALYRNLLSRVRQGQSNDRREALVENELGLDEQDSGNYAAAETAFNTGLQRVRTAAADNSLLITLETHLAELYIAESRAEDAEPILRRTLAAARASKTAHPLAVSVLNEDLAVVCIMRRKFAEPEGLLRESQVLIAKEFGPDDERLTSGLLTYAGFLAAQHRYAEAVVPAEHAWHILSVSSKPIPKPYQASALSVLGAVYYRVGRMDEALDCAHRSVDLALASLGPHHPRLGLYYGSYASILKAAGRGDEAKAMQRKAGEIMGQSAASLAGGYTVNVASLH